MSKLVDKERLAKLAKALNDRMKAAVKAEETRALTAEARIEGKADANATAIAAINNVENGLLKQAQNYADEKDGILNSKIDAKVSQSAYDAQVALLVGKDNEQAGLINGLDAAVKSIEAKMGDGDLDLPAIDKAITDFKAEQKDVDAAQDQKVAALEEAVFGKEDGKAGLEKEMDAAEARIKNLEDADFAGKISKEETDRKSADEKLTGDIAALDARVVANENFVKKHSHEDIEGRLDNLEALFEGDESVDSKIDAVHQEVVALESKHDLAVQTQATKDQQQDEAIAAKVAKADYDEKVEELEGKDVELNQAIVNEAARAAGVEQGLQQAIDDINNAEDGILAQAKSHAQGLVDGEKGLREQADTALDNRLKAVENSVGQGGALEVRVAANEAKLAGLKKDTVQAAINQAEADAKAHAEQKIAELVDSAPDAMNTLNELAEAIKAHGTEYEAYVATVSQNIATAKQEAITAASKDAASKDAALKSELQAEIDDDVKAEADRAKGEEQAIRNEFAAADTKVLEDAAVDAAAKVAVEKGRAEEQEAAIRQEMANEATRVNQKIAADIATESAARVLEEQDIRADFAAADSVLDGRIKTLEGLVVGGEGEGLEAVISDVAKNKQDIVDLKAADVTLQSNIDKKVAIADYNTKVQALEGADSALDNRIKVFEAGGAQDVAAKEVRLAAAEQNIVDLKASVAAQPAKDKALQDQITENKTGVASNKAAIEVLNGDATKDGSVAKSIADALAPYATEAETLAVIGQVVNSLALTMENNRIVLKLGGINGVAINEVSLDMVTDADIDEIIAGLDKE